MINYLSKPFKWFFKLEAASGLVLLFAAIIALLISNSEYSELYFSDVFWPSFKKKDLLKAVQTYQMRKRRYGE